jgi:outer membrane protein assembly factor BamB
MRPIYAIRPDAAGDISETKAGVAWSHDRAGNYIQTPLLSGGLGYFCYDNGVLSVYQLATGEKVYQERLGSGTSGFTSSPVAAGGHLFITNEEGRTYVLKLGSRYQPAGQNDLGETVMATAAISGDVIYLRGRKHLFAVGRKNR